MYYEIVVPQSVSSSPILPFTLVYIATTLTQATTTIYAMLMSNLELCTPHTCNNKRRQLHILI